MSAATEVGAAIALTRLPLIGAARLATVLRHHPPAEALAALAGDAPLHPMVSKAIPARERSIIRAAARRASPSEQAERCDAAGVQVVWAGSEDYPVALAADTEAPAVLFMRGDPAALHARRVGIVGTRNATAAGLATARELGSALSAAGVAVVSGLARGIDGGAHEGVRRRGGPGRAVGVVGCGPDVIYPRRHAALWNWVASVGLLVSEFPPGTPPEAWRFPERNRIIAGLSEVLVVVESRERGGSLITARMAADRGVEVMAVPGSTRCRASRGTNHLIRDGAAPVTCVDDVLTMLCLDHRRQGERPFDPRPLPVGDEARVLRACEREPSTIDMIAAASGMSIVAAALAAARLERSGWLFEAGGWFEPASSRLRRADELTDSSER